MKQMKRMFTVLAALLPLAAAAAEAPWDAGTPIDDVISYPAFGAWGRLLFPVQEGYYSGSTLGSLQLMWYTGIQPAKTVEIANFLRERADSGAQVCFDIYTEEEKKSDPRKRLTGLIYFPGKPGGRVAVCNAGGGFAYVGAMHDSFPHALELSRMGYHAFALIYRPGAQTACEDLARAIAFLFGHQAAFQMDMTGYSLWGGSAGARMAAWLGSHGTEAFGEKPCPRPGAVIMQYTGHSEVTGDEPPTYSCVGTGDGIASYRTMERRTAAIQANGTNAMIQVFPGLPHGFGLGTGTLAEGWLNQAAAFWEAQLP